MSQRNSSKKHKINKKPKRVTKGFNVDSTYHSSATNQDRSDTNDTLLCVSAEVNPPRLNLASFYL